MNKLIIILATVLTSCTLSSKTANVTKEEAVGYQWVKNDSVEVFKEAFKLSLKNFVKNKVTDTLYFVKNNFFDDLAIFQPLFKGKLLWAERRVIKEYGMRRIKYFYKHQLLRKNEQTFDLIHFVHIPEYALVEILYNETGTQTLMIGKSGDVTPWKVLNVYESFFNAEQRI